MWYTTHVPDQASTIHLATSPDGLVFTPIEGPHAGAVLAKNEEQWWAFDTAHVALGDVVSGSSARVRADGDVVFLYYTGFSAAMEPATKLRAGDGKIGVALSKDGQHFSRLEGELPSGAVLEGDPDAFDAAGVFSPCICSIGAKTVMHYHTYSDKTGYQIGRAESDDGISFRKTGPVLLAGDPNFLSGGALNPCVVKSEKGYMMFVEAVSAGRSGIALCESDDSKNWGPLKLVLDDSHTSEGTGSPYTLPMSDGSLRLYYTRYEGNHCSLAFAESQGTDWSLFNTSTSLTIQ